MYLISQPCLRSASHIVSELFTFKCNGSMLSFKKYVHYRISVELLLVFTVVFAGLKTVTKKST